MRNGRLWRCRLDRTLEHRADVLRLVAIRVADHERGAAIHASEPGRADEEASLFPHLSYHGIGRRFSELDRAARGGPDTVVALAHEQDAAIRMANDSGYGRHEETPVADGASEIAHVWGD